MSDEQPSLFAARGPEIGEIEAWCLQRGIFPVIGVDEAGRGPLAGPVYAAAVVLDCREQPDWLEILDDSKKLKAEVREEAAGLIKEHALAWAIARRDHDVIDDINILQASLRAMEDAVEQVCAAIDTSIQRVFVDGNQPIRTEVPQQPLVKGDGRSYHVAAASILAKVARDQEMLEHHLRWPHYAFDSNKGYGTAAHRKAIAEIGPCPIHRKSFGGVREYLSQS